MHVGFVFFLEIMIETKCLNPLGPTWLKQVIQNQFYVKTDDKFFFFKFTFFPLFAYSVSLYIHSIVLFFPFFFLLYHFDGEIIL